MLLLQPPAAASLKPLLPSLSALLFDSSLPVRLAHANLLRGCTAAAGSVLRFTDAATLDEVRPQHDDVSLAVGWWLSVLLLFVQFLISFCS